MNWSETYKPVRMASWDDIADSIRQTVTMGEAVAMYAPDPPPKGRRIPCPIHNGKDYNLSFTDNRFRCFVCNEGGDVIAFVRSVCGLNNRKEAMIKINEDYFAEDSFVAEKFSQEFSKSLLESNPTLTWRLEFLVRKKRNRSGS